MFGKILPLGLYLLLNAVLSLGQHDASLKAEKRAVSEIRRQACNIPAPLVQITLRKTRWIDIQSAIPDSLSVGFVQSKSENKHFLTLSKGFQSATEAFIRQYLAFGTDDSLKRIVMVIKKLWLTDELIPIKKSINNIHHAESDETTITANTSGIMVKVEFYLANGSDYIPLYRYDSTLSGKLTIAENSGGYLREALEASLEKLIRMDENEWPLGKRRLSMDEINQFNDRSQRFAILHDSLPNAGVYKTFEEFRNNRPTLTDFEVKKDKLNDIIYVKQADGKYLPEREVWGYSDGKVCYIKSAENYFRLQRARNAYYIYGAKFVGRAGAGYQPTPVTSSAGALGGTAAVAVIADQFQKKYYTMDLKPYQLDWDNGQLF